MNYSRYLSRSITSLFAANVLFSSVVFADGISDPNPFPTILDAGSVITVKADGNYGGLCDNIVALWAEGGCSLEGGSPQNVTSGCSDPKITKLVTIGSNPTQSCIVKSGYDTKSGVFGNNVSNPPAVKETKTIVIRKYVAWNSQADVWIDSGAYTRTAGVSYTDGRTTGAAYSGNGTDGVCTVTSVGVVTNKSPGLCKIRLTDSHGALTTAQWNIFANFKYTILESSIAGDTYNVSMMVQNGSNQNIAAQPGKTYSSLTTGVCTISSAGAVFNVNPGYCKVNVAIPSYAAPYNNVTYQWAVGALQRTATYTVTHDANGNALPAGTLFTTETPLVCGVTESGAIQTNTPGDCVIRAYTNPSAGTYSTIIWPIISDLDRDGVPDSRDNCPASANPNQALNIDGDSKGDVCDEDMDGDGVLNDTDICPNVNNPAQNKLTDICWTTGDSDGDGAFNNVDNCPNKPNPIVPPATAQPDMDNDGLGDVCDTDRDGDGKLNIGDNCPDTANPDQGDANGDGVGDACERKFVKTTGLDTNDCSSWAMACKTIQRGIDAAQADGLKQVFIAKGTYRPALTVTLKKGISLYGGFVGASNELTPAFAQPSVNKTIISGDKDANDAVDADGIVQAVAGISGTNLSGGILAASNQGIAAADKIRLSGLILNAGSNTSASLGGALTVIASNVELVNTQVIANRAPTGGGLYIAGAGTVVAVDGSTLKNNVATTGTAGGIYDAVTSTGSVTITNSTLAGNSAGTGQYGGAINKALGSTSIMVISNSTLDSNTAGYAGALYHQGGRLEIGKGSIFRANKALTDAGGAIRSDATGTTSAVMVIDKAEFDANSAKTLGGAIYMGSTTSSNDTQLISSSLFTANTAETNGGAIATNVITAASAKLQLVNNTFFGNLAGANADGTAAATSGSGGALFVQSTNKSIVELDYNTLVANESKSAAGQGGGILVQSITPASLFKISRSIVAGNITINANNGLNAWLGAAVTDNGYNLLGFNGVAGVAGTGTLNAATNIKPTAVEAPTLDKIVEAVPVIDGGDGYYNINAPLPVLPIIGGGKARDAIPSTACGTILTDARGERRPDAKAQKCDIGAYEYTVLTCQEDAQRRYDQGELFIKACTPQTENLELKVGAWNGIGIMLLGLLAMLRRRQLFA